MKIILITGVIATFLTLTISCKKESTKESQISVPNFLDCYHSQTRDSTFVANKLIGTWKWKEQSCMNSSRMAGDNNVVKVTFKSTGIFAITENSNVVTLGNWKIKMEGSNFWGIDSTLFELVIDEPNNFLNGVILLCGNQVLFSGSYADGCNTLFDKEE